MENNLYDSRSWEQKLSLLGGPALPQPLTLPLCERIKMAKGIKKKLCKAIDRVSAHIGAKTDQASLYSRGLSSEGYDGGYRDALSDVLLLLNGVFPNTRNEYWNDHSWLDKYITAASANRK